ncbi:MAG: damage-inducible protein DinB, partial [Mucilaginibacter sp.]|nr:damage-inducible protein DinB [Mucilaginibacter sp.]
MKLKSLMAALCLIVSGQLAMAQVKVAELVKEWERSKAYTKEYLDAMPESSYTLKPTPEMRSFAEQNLHLADAN